MFKILLLIFIAVPLLEMSLLFQVSDAIGGWYTLGLVVLTAIIGSLILRVEGFNTLMRARDRLSTGNLPTTELAEGFLLAISGALLLTPGFITDAIGFLGMIPFTRRLIAATLVKKFSSHISYQTHHWHNEPSSSMFDDGNSTVIDGECEQESEKK